MNSDSDHSRNHMAAQILPLVALWAGGILAASIEAQYREQVEWSQPGETQLKGDDGSLSPAGRSLADAVRLFAGEEPRTDWSDVPQPASVPERYGATHNGRPIKLAPPPISLPTSCLNSGGATRACRLCICS